MPPSDLPVAFLNFLRGFIDTHGAVLLLLAASALASGFGAWFGAAVILAREDDRRQRNILSSANISIAALVALLGKLINFKKDLCAPAEAEAFSLSETLRAADAPPDPADKPGADKPSAEKSPTDRPPGDRPAEKNHVSISLELWPDFPFELRLVQDNMLAYAGGELDAIQLLKMLDYNLAELSHLVRQRNALIQQMNTHQTARGALPLDGLRLYLRYAAEIARNVDENLFFIDRAIVKVRAAAKNLLPASLHANLADVSLKMDAAPFMPAKDLIKGWA